ncbi:hypothetical protein ABH926_006799 [Catenulispora sp. GP43]|uniref:eCIS core domain-containing protein n=1 Tax=Catenulispora sp. GP43 TaxID=3156263 RepID=UPI0035183C58
MRSQEQGQRNSDSGDSARGRKTADARQASTPGITQLGLSLAEYAQAVPSKQLAYSPGTMFQLQRAIGNAAVSRLVNGASGANSANGADQHTHSPGCGHGSGQGPAEAPVQRSLVPGVLSSPGTPLAAPVRADMEARLGADFSDVRLHTDSVAHSSAAEIGARAYTSGSHIVIGEGGGDSHTLAHELTHVIQQRRGSVAGTDNGSGLSVSDPGDRFEREAEANATRVMASAPPVSDTQDAGAQDTAAANPGLQPTPSVQPAPAVQRAPATSRPTTPPPAHQHKMPAQFPRHGKILEKCKAHMTPPFPIGDGTFKPPMEGDFEFTEKQVVLVPDDPSPHSDWIGVSLADDRRGSVYWIKTSQVRVDAKPTARDFSQTAMGADQAGPNDVAQGQIGDCYLMAALAAVALQQPHFIDGMIRQDAGGVHVRFHRKSGGQKGTRATFAPEWVDVDMRLFVKGNDTKPVYAAAHKSLWPAMIEKAYAVFKGRARGYEGIGRGGRPKEALEAILGVEAGSHEIGPYAASTQDEHNPFAITDEAFVHPFSLDEGSLTSRVGLTAAQAKSFRTQSRKYADRKTVLKKSPHAYTDIALVLGCATDAAAKTKLQTYCADHLEQPLKSGKYSATAEHVWNKIQAKFLAGETIVLSSKTWGSQGEGHSAGEDIKVVPGIAATHAYTVMGVHSEMDKASGKEIKYVTVRNPWGVFGRGYTTSWNPLTLGAHTGVKKDDGTFHLELSDLVRYFNMADHAPAPAPAPAAATAASASGAP